MSEIIKERLTNSLGKVIKVFLNNGFRFEGKLTNLDDKYLEILDFRSQAFKIILLDDIKDLEVGK